MHETHILKNIFRYLAGKEKSSSRKIRKIYIALSEFASIKKEHFLEHYKEEAAGTRWEGLEVEVKKTATGPELEITRIDFEK